MKSFYRYSLTCFAILISSLAYAQSGDHIPQAKITDNQYSTIDRVLHDQGYTMIQGNLTQVSSYVGSLTKLNPATGKADLAFPRINGSVEAVVSDEAGGWYVGGSFSTYSNIKVQNLIHIKSDLSLDENWKPAPDFFVRTLLVSGGKLYVGGSFTKINGQTQNALARFTIATGALDAWTANITGSYVNTIALNGTTLYIGGTFTTVGGLARTNAAALDIATPTTTTWIANANSDVTTLAIQPATGLVFLGGYFTIVNGATRNRLAAVNATTGALNAWNPNMNSSVQKLLVDNTDLYAGGYFSTFAATTRPALIKFNVATATPSSTPLAFNANIPGGSSVEDIAVSGTNLYIAGSFSTINGETVRGIALLNATTAAVNTAFNPNLYLAGTVRALLLQNNVIMAAGDIRGADAEAMPGRALFLPDHTAWPYIFSLAGGETIYAIAVQGTTLYVGGRFNLIGKDTRRNLAAFNLTTGALLPWNPSVDNQPNGLPGTVYDMKISNNQLYVGGQFTSVNGAAHAGLVALDLSTGTAGSWAPIVGTGKTADQFVRSLDIRDNTVYIAGDFVQVNAQPRGYLAAVDATTGAITPWNPNSAAPVTKVRVAEQAAYVLGDFSKGVGGQVRSMGIASLNRTNGNINPWNPSFYKGVVNDLALNATDVFVGGSFDSLANAAIRRTAPGLVSFNLSTTELNNWTPDIRKHSYFATYIVRSVAASNARLFVSGGFDFVGNDYAGGFAEYCVTTASIRFVNSALQASAATSYQWYKNGKPVAGATGQTLNISLLETGIYAVEVSDGGCTDRSEDFPYYITDAEIVLSAEVSAYPNPVSDDLHVRWPGQQPADITILDLAGRVVRSEPAHGQHESISLITLQPGTYLVRIQTGQFKTTQKIIKTH
jgi:hypothetical protein